MGRQYGNTASNLSGRGTKILYNSHKVGKKRVRKRMKSTSIFLIQLLLWLSIIFAGMPASYAVMMPNQQVQAVQALEDTLFAIHYDQEPLDARVGRLEDTVFGQVQTGSSIEARIIKLQGSLSPKALGPLSPVSKATGTQTAAKNNTQAVNPGNSANAETARNQPLGNNNNAPNYNTATKQTPAGPQKIASANGLSSSGLGNINRVQGHGNTGNTAGLKGAGPATAISPEPGETDYPTVTQMEMKVFGKTFPKEDITQRLNRLEVQVFKMPQTGALSDRTDNLRLVVLGDTGQAQAANNTGYADPNNYGIPVAPQNSTMGYGYPQAPNYGGNGANGNYGYNNGDPQQASYNPAYNGGQPYNGQGNYGVNNTVASAAGGSPMPGYGNTGAGNYQPSANTSAPTPDMMAAMSEVEKEVLGTTYPAEPINTRLDRVETKVFKATSPDMNPQDRIQRVIAVASAGGAPMNNKTKAKATLQTILPIILTLLPLILL